MTYKQTLQRNNNNLQTILDNVNALPDAGGSGDGGSVETCTVVLNGYNTLEECGIVASVINNGKVETVNEYFGGSKVTLLNVVCGSVMALYSMSGSNLRPITTITGSAVNILKDDTNRLPFLISAPTVADEECLIIVSL